MRIPRLSGSALSFLLSLLLIPTLAQAYIDPGGLSFVIQILVASFVGALVAMRIYWQKFKDTVSNLFRTRRLRDTPKNHDEEES